MSDKKIMNKNTLILLVVMIASILFMTWQGQIYLVYSAVFLLGLCGIVVFVKKDDEAGMVTAVLILAAVLVPLLSILHYSGMLQQELYTAITETLFIFSSLLCVVTAIGSHSPVSGHAEVIAFSIAYWFGFGVLGRIFLFAEYLSQWQRAALILVYACCTLGMAWLMRKYSGRPAD